MTHEEWLTCTDARPMLEVLWKLHGGDETILVPRLHRCFMANARLLWNLLPHPRGRRCLELAERQLNGETIEETLDTEGASFEFSAKNPSDEVLGLVAMVERDHAEELQGYIRRTDHFAGMSTREVLADIAYYIEFAVHYPQILPKPDSWWCHTMLLSPDLLREHFGNPFADGPRSSPPRG